MKTFRPYQPQQLLLLPEDMRKWLPADHLAHFISEVVESFDLSAITAEYERELRGNPPWHPQMMVKLWLYGYCVGKPSSRQVERACLEEVPFRVLSANSQPDHRPLSEFRRRHLQALCGLFVQVLQIARKAGLVSLGYVALDGTKVKANASRHKAMSYQRMREGEERLTGEIQALLEAGVALDEAEDRRYGKDRRGDELPAELARREQRLRVIREAQAAADRMSGEPPSPAVPKDKAQRNFTDPESRIMKSSEKAFIQAYNCQAAVDGRAQIIVACAVSGQAADTPQLEPMLERVIENCGEAPRRLSADAGYCSENNLAIASEHGIDTYIATGKDQRHRQGPAPPHTAAGAAGACATGVIGQGAHGAQAADEERQGLVRQTQRAGGAGIRADQAGAEIPTVSPARAGEDERGMVADMHRSQPAADVAGEVRRGPRGASG